MTIIKKRVKAFATLTLIIFCIVVSTGCSDNNVNLKVNSSIIDEILSGEYTNLTPLAKSNIEACKDYFKFNPVDEYTYEILESKCAKDAYYTIIINDSTTLDFVCILNLWLEEDGTVKNAVIEYADSKSADVIESYKEVSETEKYHIDYEEGFIPGQNNLIMGGELQQETSNSMESEFNIDEFLEQKEQETKVFVPREEMEGKELATRPVETTDPSISFVYE